MRLTTFLRFSKLKYITNPISGKPIPNSSKKILPLIIDNYYYGGTTSSSISPSVFNIDIGDKDDKEGNIVNVTQKKDN